MVVALAVQRVVLLARLKVDSMVDSLVEMLVETKAVLDLKMVVLLDL